MNVHAEHESVFFSGAEWIAINGWIVVQSLYNNQCLLVYDHIAVHTFLPSRVGTGIVAEQAYTQRGMIRRLQQQDELAYEDFQKAAGLGGVFARRQCTQLNPYAKLCNQMLQDAFEKLQGTEMK